MGKEDKIDELFREGLQNFEAPVDPSVWAGIQSGLSSSAAGSAAAGATSITAKVIGFGIAAVVAVGVGIGIYQASQSEEEKPNKNQDQPVKELVEDHQESIQPVIEKTLSQAETKPTENKIEENHDGLLVHNEESKEKVSAIDNTEKQSDQEDVLKAKQDQEEQKNTSDSSDKETNVNAEESSNQNSQEEQTDKQVEEKIEKLVMTTSLSETKGKAPLTVQLSGNTNGSDIEWTIGNGKEELVLNGNLQNHVFTEKGVYLIRAKSTLESQEAVQEMAVEVSPEKSISLSIKDHLLSRDKGVFITPNASSNRTLEFNIENEEDFIFFKLTVLNGGGSVLYETNNLSQRNWNGVDMNGVDLPAGQDYYIIIVAGDKNNQMIDPIRKRLSIIR